MVPRWPSKLWQEILRQKTLPETWTTFGRYLVPSIEVRSVSAPHAMLCWSRATLIMQIFVVGEKYLTVNLKTEIWAGLRNKLVETKSCIPVNDKPTAPHPVSPKLFKTLCFNADHIALPSIEFVTVDFPSCAVPCAMGMNSTRIQRFWPLSNFRDGMDVVYEISHLESNHNSKIQRKELPLRHRREWERKRSPMQSLELFGGSSQNNLGRLQH